MKKIVIVIALISFITVSQTVSAQTPDSLVERTLREYDNKIFNLEGELARLMMKKLEVILGDGMRVRQLPCEADERGYRIAFVTTPECPKTDGVDLIVLWHNDSGQILKIKALVTHRQGTEPYAMLTALVTDGENEGELYVHELHLLRTFLDGNDKKFKNCTDIRWKSAKGMRYKDLYGNSRILREE